MEHIQMGLVNISRLTLRKRKKKPRCVLVARFRGVNTPAVAGFIQRAVTEQGLGGGTQLALASRGVPHGPLTGGDRAGLAIHQHPSLRHQGTLPGGGVNPPRPTCYCVGGQRQLTTTDSPQVEKPRGIWLGQWTLRQ